MKCLNNRADSHLTGQVECELDGVGNGAWVNRGFCGTPPPIPRVVSTIYDPKPLFQGSMDSIYKLEPHGPFPEVPPSTDQSLVKKQRGCCSFIKGRNPSTTSYFCSNGHLYGMMVKYGIFVILQQKNGNVCFSVSIVCNLLYLSKISVDGLIVLSIWVFNGRLLIWYFISTQDQINTPSA